MKYRKVIALCSVLLLAALITSSLFNAGLWTKKEKPRFRISVIAHGKNTESWTLVWQGVEQAARDYNVELTPVYLAKENDAREQIEMLEREVKNGAQAVVLAPVDSATLRIPVVEARTKVPVIAIESTVQGMEGLPYVGCDNAALGQQLAKRALDSGKKRVAVVQSSVQSGSVRQRFTSFFNTMYEHGVTPEIWKIPQNSTQAYTSLKKQLQEGDVQTAVAVDSTSLELLAAVEKELSPPGVTAVHIYGIGRSDRIVGLLEEHVISEIALPNDYNMGYLGISTAVNARNRKKDIQTHFIDFTFIPYAEMYTPENQRRLFPFVN